MSTKLHDQVRETMRKEEARKSRRRDYSRATIEHDGHSADTFHEEVKQDLIDHGFTVVPGAGHDQWPGEGDEELDAEAEADEREGIRVRETETGVEISGSPDELIDGFHAVTQRLRSGQAIIPGMERELFNYDDLIRYKIEELVDSLGVPVAEVAVAVKLKGTTKANGVAMDVETKISVKMKPAKEGSE